MTGQEPSEAGPTVGTVTSQPLTSTEAAILEFERRQWKYPGVKEAAILEAFDMSPTRYHQVLNALLDRPEALEYHPQTVRRLQRLRDARRGRRVTL